MAKRTTYRNRIEAMLGIGAKDVEDIAGRSPLVKQRRKQKARWGAHLARKAAS